MFDWPLCHSNGPTDEHLPSERQRFQALVGRALWARAFDWGASALSPKGGVRAGDPGRQGFTTDDDHRTNLNEVPTAERSDLVALDGLDALDGLRSTSSKRRPRSGARTVKSFAEQLMSAEAISSQERGPALPKPAPWDYPRREPGAQAPGTSDQRRLAPPHDALEPVLRQLETECPECAVFGASLLRSVGIADRAGSVSSFRLRRLAIGRLVVHDAQPSARPRHAPPPAAPGRAHRRRGYC